MEERVRFVVDDLRGEQIQALLEEHMRHMHELSPPESVHALDLEKLRHPSITFWSAWRGEDLLGCGALKELDPTHGEVKSMRTVSSFRRQGTAGAMLERILSVGKERGYRRLSLETGAQPGFAPARHLYKSFGFVPCGPFGSYTLDPNSVFMTKQLPTT